MRLQRQDAIDNPMDRLRDLDMDSFDRDTDSNLSSMRGGGKIGKKGEKIYDLHNKKNNPFMNETLSEINDDKEKNAIFNHSMRHGVFNDLRNSPLKDKMPNNL